MCIHGEVCGKAVAVKHDGSVYACDHFVYPEHRLGTVQEDDLLRMVFSRRQVRFGFAKSETLPRYCRGCPCLSECLDECPKNRMLRTPDGGPGLNCHCRGLKAFYAHALPEIDRIVAGLRGGALMPRERM